VDQRHVHLAGHPLEPAHRVLHHRVLDAVALLAEALVDALGGVALLLRQRLVRLQHLLDALQVRPQLGLASLRPHPIARRLGVPQDLLQRRPVHPVLPEHLALRLAIPQYLQPDPRP